MAFHPPITDTERISRLASRVSDLETRLRAVERESTDILGTSIECFQKDEAKIDTLEASNKFKDTKIAQQAAEIRGLRTELATVKGWAIRQKERADAHKARYYEAVYGGGRYGSR